MHERGVWTVIRREATWAILALGLALACVGGWLGTRFASEEGARRELLRRLMLARGEDFIAQCAEASRRGRAGIGALLELADAGDPTKATHAANAIRDAMDRIERLPLKQARARFDELLREFARRADACGTGGYSLIAQGCEQYLLWVHRHSPGHREESLRICGELLRQAAGARDRDAGLSRRALILPSAATSRSTTPLAEPANLGGISPPQGATDIPGGGLPVRPHGGDIPLTAARQSAPPALLPLQTSGLLDYSRDHDGRDSIDAGSPSTPGMGQASTTAAEAGNMDDARLEKEIARRQVPHLVEAVRRLHRLGRDEVPALVNELIKAGWTAEEIDAVFRTTHPNVRIRREVFPLLSAIPVETATALLRLLVLDPVEGVRLAALDAMLQSDPRRFRVEYAALSSRDGSPRIRIAARIAQRMTDPRASVRAALAGDAAALSQMDARAVLLHLSRDEDKAVRLAVVNALAASRDHTLGQRLEEMERTDRDPEVRAAAGLRLAQRDGARRLR